MLMFDKDYFLTLLPQQITMITRKPAVEVSLYSGSRYHVHEVKEARDGYVWLQVFPPEGKEIEVEEELEKEVGRVRSGFNTEEVGIAYEAIEQVRVFKGPARGREIGFKAHPAARRR